MLRFELNYLEYLIILSNIFSFLVKSNKINPRVGVPKLKYFYEIFQLFLESAITQVFAINQTKITKQLKGRIRFNDYLSIYNLILAILISGSDTVILTSFVCVIIRTDY